MRLNVIIKFFGFGLIKSDRCKIFWQEQIDLLTYPKMSLPLQQKIFEPAYHIRLGCFK